MFGNDSKLLMDVYSPSAHCKEMPSRLFRDLQNFLTHIDDYDDYQEDLKLLINEIDRHFDVNR